MLAIIDWLSAADGGNGAPEGINFECILKFYDNDDIMYNVLVVKEVNLSTNIQWAAEVSTPGMSLPKAFKSGRGFLVYKGLQKVGKGTLGIRWGSNVHNVAYFNGSMMDYIQSDLPHCQPLSDQEIKYEKLVRELEDIKDENKLLREELEEVKNILNEIINFKDNDLDKHSYFS